MANIVGSKIFELVVLALVLMYSIVIMTQETGQSDKLLAAASNMQNAPTNSSADQTNNTASMMALVGVSNKSLMIWLEFVLVICFCIEFLLKVRA